MMNYLRSLASLKVTLFGMALLSAGAMAIYGNPIDIPAWVLTVPLVLLALNLSAAILTNVRINQQMGLLVFHVCLLGLVILAGIGRLTYLDSHVELPIDSEFSPQKVLEVQKGLAHSGAMDKVAFVQGRFTVNYAANMQRGLTHSYVQVKMPTGEWEERVVGDDRPLVLEGYRFYTTHNKGFTTTLTWQPDEGEAQTGTINMPAYPLFEYKQDNRWIPPQGGAEIKFWLQLKTAMDEKNAWVLDLRNSSAVLVVTHNDQRSEVQAGESVRLGAGTLRFDKLTMWMGYRIFYDPTIQWMFFVSVAGVLGLGQYFWTKLNLQPWMEADGDESQSEHQNADESTTAKQGERV